MSLDPPPPPLTFQALMAAAIPAAQRASGGIWTDYNLHDPGVTLLEQTCFALTEIAYRADHPVRDHLTDPKGRFAPSALALPLPRRVLPGRPVTALDLAGHLSALPGVARVFVTPHPATGLFAIRVVPAPRTDGAVALAAVRRAFAAVRMVGSDAALIALAPRKGLHLRGTVGLRPLAKPNRVAAEIVHAVTLALQGLDCAEASGREGARRADVWDDPAAVWPRVRSEPGDPSRPDLVLAALERIEGVESLRDLALVDAESGAPLAPAAFPGTVFEVLLPRPDAPLLVLTRNGGPVPLDPQAVAAEHDKLAAARIGKAGNRLDRRDFDMGYPGRPRSAARVPVDVDLPRIYRLRAAGQMASYRTMIEGHLAAVAAPLAGLRRRYGLCTPRADEDAAALRRRVGMLDYLIALQGEEMPGTAQAALHVYRTPARQLRWAVDWRARYLRKLPEFNRFAGTAHPHFGLAARMAHLADLDRGRLPGEAMSAAGLALDPGAPVPPGLVSPDAIVWHGQPHDLLMHRDGFALPLPAADLLPLAPWVAGGRTTPALFARAADPDAWLLAPDPAGGWRVLFEGQPGGDLHACTTCPDRPTAEALANRLCSGWQALNRACEGLVLLEDILLRDPGDPGGAARAAALVAGWTARTAQPAFRLHVEDMIGRTAPAHVHVRILWLSPSDALSLGPALAAWRAGAEGAGPALRAALRAIEAAR